MIDGHNMRVKKSKQSKMINVLMIIIVALVYHAFIVQKNRSMEQSELEFRLGIREKGFANIPIRPSTRWQHTPGPGLRIRMKLTRIRMELTRIRMELNRSVRQERPGPTLEKQTGSVVDLKSFINNVLP